MSNCSAVTPDWVATTHRAAGVTFIVLTLIAIIVVWAFFKPRSTWPKLRVDADNKAMFYLALVAESVLLSSAIAYAIINIPCLYVERCTEDEGAAIAWIVSWPSIALVFFGMRFAGQAGGFVVLDGTAESASVGPGATIGATLFGNIIASRYA